jgi:hypothetical protein
MRTETELSRQSSRETQEAAELEKQRVHIITIPQRQRPRAPPPPRSHSHHSQTYSQVFLLKSQQLLFVFFFLISLIWVPIISSRPNCYFSEEYSARCFDIFAALS